MPDRPSGARPYRGAPKRASGPPGKPESPRTPLRRMPALRVTHCILDAGRHHVGETVYLALPLGTTHGWGVCGRYITREMARLGPVCLVTDRLDPNLVGDELELAALRGLLAPPDLQAGRAADVDSPVLQGVLGADLAPMRPRL